MAYRWVGFGIDPIWLARYHASTSLNSNANKDQSACHRKTAAFPFAIYPLLEAFRKPDFATLRHARRSQVVDSSSETRPTDGFSEVEDEGDVVMTSSGPSTREILPSTLHFDVLPDQSSALCTVCPNHECQTHRLKPDAATGHFYGSITLRDNAIAHFGDQHNHYINSTNTTQSDTGYKNLTQNLCSGALGGLIVAGVNVLTTKNSNEVSAVDILHSLALPDSGSSGLLLGDSTLHDELGRSNSLFQIADVPFSTGVDSMSGPEQRSKRRRSVDDRLPSQSCDDSSPRGRAPTVADDESKWHGPGERCSSCRAIVYRPAPVPVELPDENGNWKRFDVMDKIWKRMEFVADFDKFDQSIARQAQISGELNSKTRELHELSALLSRRFKKGLHRLDEATSNVSQARKDLKHIAKKTAELKWKSQRVHAELGGPREANSEKQHVVEEVWTKEKF